MRTETPQFIATKQLLWLRHDGAEVLITARIGTPYQIDEATWACAVELDGVDSRYPDLFGEGSIQALNMALRMVATRLAHLLDMGERLVHPEQRDCVWNSQALEGIFGPGFKLATEPVA